MSRPVVVILGGNGEFGRRIAANLAKHPGLEVVVAGRTGPLAVDVSRFDAFAAIHAARPAVVVDAVGPFQERDFALPARCAEHGIHYVDIADGRQWAIGIRAFNPQARANGVALISGASTVPAISSAIVDELSPRALEVLEIEVGIAPGQRAPRGLATGRSILSCCGKRIPPVCGTTPEFGWGGLSRHAYPAPVGRRWLSNVDTPERELWKERYPALKRATIRAGLEVGFLHLGLAALSRGVRAHVIPSLTPATRAFLWIADRFDAFGSDAGAMHVRVVTRDRDRTAHLIAERGDGPQIPAAPAALVVRKLLALPGYKPLVFRGANPCIGLLTHAEIMKELEGFAIRYVATR